MNDLNDYQAFRELDRQDMLAEIDGLPDQLLTAWEQGRQHSLPSMADIRQVVVAGMGGSAIGADLLSAYAEPLSQAQVYVHRDYGLPVWARGSHTLVIASSHSGNTEETLSAFAQAQQNACSLLVVSTGGQLAERASASGVPLWTFEHGGQPRAAVGYSFGLLLAALVQLGLLSDADAEVRSAVAAMQRQQENLRAHVAVVNNPAKRYAGQLVERWVTVIGSGLLAPVARRWKGQISEIAKTWAQFEFLPEADHNTLAGTINPEDLLSRMMTLLLVSPSDHPRNRLRSDLTRQVFMLQGLNTDFYQAQGETRMAHMWTTLHFGDYMAYYLAMAYGVDPTPVDALENFKRELRRAG